MKAPCIEANNYSYKSYMFGCNLDWFDPAKGKSNLCCSTREQILRYHDKFTWALTTGWNYLSKNSGCHPKYKVRKLNFVDKTKEKVTWRRTWASAFYLDVEFTAFEIVEEHWAYDINDTVNGIGGVLGLFLGWSLYFILSEFYLCIEKIIFQHIFNFE